MAPPGASVTQALRIGPGALRWAPIGSTVPDDLATAWDAAWSGLGYTEDGKEMENAPSFEDRRVAEELLPLATYQTEAAMNVRVALSQINTDNLKLMFNGGSVSTPATDTSVIYTPPEAGVFVPVMLGWEADDGEERMVWSKVTQVGSVTVPRRKAPAAANIPLDFKVGVPDTGEPFIWIVGAGLISA